MKILISFLVLFTCSLNSIAQQTIEEQIADTACLCISKIDTSLTPSKGSSLAMMCMQQAMYKNQEAIRKSFETEKRTEEDQDKIGIQGSPLIKVQNVLQNNCTAYQRYNSKLQERRTNKE